MGAASRHVMNFGTEERPLSHLRVHGIEGVRPEGGAHEGRVGRGAPMDAVLVAIGDVAAALGRPVGSDAALEEAASAA